MNQVYRMTINFHGEKYQFFRIKSVRANNGKPYYGISFFNSKEEDIQVEELFFESHKLMLLNNEEAKLVRTLFDA